MSLSDTVSVTVSFSVRASGSYSVRLRDVVSCNLCLLPLQIPALPHILKESGPRFDIKWDDTGAGFSAREDTHITG